MREMRNKKRKERGEKSEGKERGEALGKMERFKMSVLVKFEGGMENVWR